MSQAPHFTGVVAPVLTPFDDGGAVDPALFVAHARWLLQEGCTGLAPFGTTSEAASLGIDERMRLLDALIEGGVPADKLIPGTGLTSVPDTVRLTSHALEHGVAGVLMLPPFYYKGVHDDGIYAHFANVISAVASDRLKIFLYHIPPIAQVGFSLDLIARLVADFPATVIGLKDSSGDWANTEAVIQRFPDFTVFAGSEVFLLPTLRAGGAGCITATANVNPAALRHLYDNWQTAGADGLQSEITATRAEIQARPMIPALKAIKADMTQEPAWANTRPPLTRLAAGDAQALLTATRARLAVRA